MNLRFLIFSFVVMSSPVEASQCIMIVGTGIPYLQGSPAITGFTTPTVGQVFTASQGVWAGNPTSFAYQWYWAETTPPTPIPGAISGTYTAVDADVGHSLSVTVTATNAAGSGSATSLCL